MPVQGAWPQPGRRRHAAGAAAAAAALLLAGAGCPALGCDSAGCLDLQTDGEPLALVQVSQRRLALRQPARDQPTKAEPAAAADAAPGAPRPGAPGGTGDYSGVAASVLECASKRGLKIEGSENPMIVLTVADYDYRPALANWMVGVHRLGVDNYCVICLDEQVQAFMAERGRPCTLAAVSTKSEWKGQIWTMRWAVATHLLDSGIDVLLSDTDAIWQRNPYPLFAKGDVVSSRGPVKYGYQACMGFILFRSNPRVLDFVNGDMGQQLQKWGDDEFAMNMAIGARWVRSPWQATLFGFPMQAAGKAGDLEIVMLDALAVPRTCQEGRGLLDQAYVVHCWVSFGGENKTNGFREHGLWYLKDGWEALPTAGGTEAWLDRIAGPGAPPPAQAP